MRYFMIAWLAALLIPGIALAEVNIAAADACFAEADDNSTNPALCIRAAQDFCMDDSDATPAVSTLCYTDALTVWTEAVAMAVDGIDAGSDGGMAAVARIEAKYDMLINLLQCDRAEELAIAMSDLGGVEMALQKARCRSTAGALTYMRLFLSARANL